MRELQILSPDGKSSIIELNGERITLGRSSASELCFPDDTGLSRQHLAFEREGEGDAWVLHDLNSKNGTILNGAKVVGRWGRVEEIGALAVFLCSDNAGFITGTDILIDGGWCAM
jgi:pSer/pThr/pTyr-binding forkhead associated (FHA) protein